MAEFVPEPAQSSDLFYGSSTGGATIAITNLLDVTPPNQDIRTIVANTLASARDVVIPTQVVGNGDLMFTTQNSAEQLDRLKTVQRACATPAGLMYWKFGLHDTTGTIIVPGYLVDVTPSNYNGPEVVPTLECKVVCTGAETVTVGS